MLGISLRTAQLWVESGLLESWKTEGGHQRITRVSIERLLANPVVHSGEPPTNTIAAKKAPVAAFRILVVEDQEDLLKLYRLNLSLWPLKPKVITASNGFEAMIKICNERPDLMIADLFMPDFDGFSMLKCIREVKEYSDMPIIVITGISEADIAARGRLPEDIPVFPKPIPFAKLQQLAEELAAQKQQKLQPKPTDE